MTRYFYDSAGLLHRDGAPAVIHYEGRCAYYRHGRLHRTDGPAIDYDDDYHWYVDNEKISSWDELSRATGMSMKEVMVIALSTNRPPK